MVSYGGSIYATWFVVMSCASLGVLAGFPLSPIYLLPGLACGWTFAFLSLRAARVSAPARWASGVLLSGVVVSLLSVYASGKIFDISWDGQAYHQEAVAQLKDGWRPYPRVEPLYPTEHGMQLIHWPKGAWYAEAVLYGLTGQIETGKALNLILLTAAFALALSMLQHFGWKTGTALLVALILVANPVTLNQLFTYSNDGLLATLFSALLASLVILFRRRDWISALLAALTAATLVNLKFTGLVYAVTAAGAMVCIIFLDAARRSQWKHAIILLGGIVWGCLVIGYNPYLTNWSRFGNPLFPMAGPNSYYSDVFIQKDRPANLQHVGRLERLGLSIFSRTENVAAPLTSRFKWPFWIYRDELGTICSVCPDIRAAGWGPWFSGSLLLSLPILALILIRIPSLRWPTAVILLTLSVSVLVNSECWWARYVPQLWLIPAATAVIAISSTANPVIRHWGRIVMVTLAINAAMMGGLNLYGNIQASVRIREQLTGLSATKRSIAVYFSWFRANRYRLKEAGVAYREIPTAAELSCPRPETLIASQARYCLDP